MNMELSQRISELVKQLVDKFHAEKIILFGSAARGEMSSDSDLDILIIKKDVPTRGIDRQMEVDRLIKRNGIALDILVYKPEELEAAIKLGDPFIKEILSKGRTIYG